VAAKRNRGKTRGCSCPVLAGLVPAIPIIGAPCPPDRDRRDKPGDDAPAGACCAPVTAKRYFSTLWPLRCRECIEA